MTGRREQPFRCDYEGRYLHVFAHVRAWDGPEALSLFEAELRGEGVQAPGTMEVTPLGAATPVATARFRPARRRRASRAARQH